MKAFLLIVSEKSGIKIPNTKSIKLITKVTGIYDYVIELETKSKDSAYELKKKFENIKGVITATLLIEE